MFRSQVTLTLPWVVLIAALYVTPLRYQGSTVPNT